MSSSIKNLAKDLKNGSGSKKEVAPKQKSEVLRKVDDEVPFFFLELKDELKNKEYSNKATSYIDEDISEVLTLIKTKGKIPIASLLSHIVEEWINNNHNHIQSLPSNKYLK
jgi:hypothetical protein